MDKLPEQFVAFLPLLGTAAGVLLVLFGLNWLLLARNPQLGKDRRLPRQLVLLGFTVAGTVAIVITVPVDSSTRNQLIALIGVLFSASLAFSSTTIVANFMAGIMLHITKPFRVGDFIHVGDHFGRVAERGLLDTEIQTERRRLISLPNTYLISNPVAVVRSSGAIISATLSLGYDVHHHRVEPLLLKAARQTGLDEPFVLITELGNHAVTFRVSGLLTEVKSMLTTRSKLHREILDTLHGDGIEIVSPSFMNQRPLADQTKIVPRPTTEAPSVDSSSPEEILFDKAEKAEQREGGKQKLRDEIQELETQVKGAKGDEKQQLTDSISRKREQLAELENSEQETDEDQQ